MKKIRALVLLSIICQILLVNCGGYPPESKDVKKIFTQLYPNTDVVKVKCTYIDPCLVNYAFTYRKPGSTENKEIVFAWVYDEETKSWRIRPDPPKELP